jgi:hypothetical protein
MREIRLYGSEGGEAQAFPTPISFPTEGLRAYARLVIPGRAAGVPLCSTPAYGVLMKF